MPRPDRARDGHGPARALLAGPAGSWTLAAAGSWAAWRRSPTSRLVSGMLPGWAVVLPASRGVDACLGRSARSPGVWCTNPCTPSPCSRSSQPRLPVFSLSRVKWVRAAIRRHA